MSEKIFFTSDNSFGFCGDGQEKTFESSYINKYKQNLIALKNKSEWKNTGSSASFQERGYDDSELEQGVSASVTGICAYEDGQFVITQSVGGMSGIFYKTCNEGAEQFLIHSNAQRFHSPDYNKASKEVLAGVENNPYTCDIALFDINTNNLKTITGGDSFDSDPSFSKGRDLILFASRGIGRNSQMQFVSYGPSSVYAVSRDASTFKEILSGDKTDYLMPKEDKDGNLYYIKKPYVPKGVKQPLSFLDIILAPFRLIHGFFKLIFFLSMQNSKENRRKYQKSKGDNPAKYQDPEKAAFFNEEIDFEKEEAKNIKSGNANAGFAPGRFELCKADKNGEKVIKKGVLSYCVLDDGSIIYTNGRCIIKLLSDGSENVLYKGKRIFGIGAESSGHLAPDPIFG